MASAALFLTYVLTAASPTPRGSMADVAFIAGHWRDVSEGLSEEIWTAPEGDAMLGMWRMVSGGKARIYELLSIRQEEAGPVLLLRHFEPRLKAREDKDAPLSLPLVRAAAGEAVFEGKSAAGGLLRLTYRQRGEDGLEATLEKDGGPPELFKLQRVKP